MPFAGSRPDAGTFGGRAWHNVQTSEQADGNLPQVKPHGKSMSHPADIETAAQAALEQPGSANAPRILPAKYMPPRVASHHLARAHLVEQLHRCAQSSRLILIRAAAGSGKTTLLQQYHQRRLDQGQASLWINLDAGDNDLSRFVQVLDQGLRRVQADAVHLDPLTQNAQQLLERIGRCRSSFSLLLDELEVIQDPAVLSLLQQIIEALPHGSVVLAATRQLPGLDLAQLSRRSQLYELPSSLLRFSLEETTTFVRDKRQLPLLNNLVAALYLSTEGWVTALHLACLSLQGKADPAASIAAFSGTQLELAEYLAEDIFARLDDELRLFLMQTSVLERFCVPLCDHVRGRNDSAAVLQRLERESLFLIPLDNEQHWFRYHSLFSGFLRSLLERRLPGRKRELLQRAAHWFLAADLPARAIQCLIDAGDPAEAARQLARHCDALLETGRTRMLLRWLDRIPETLLGEHPRLILAYAWALLFARRLHDARRLIDQLGQFGEVHEVQTLRCLLQSVTDQPEACCEIAAELLREHPVLTDFQRVVVINTLGFSLVCCGRHDEARALMAASIERPRHSPLMRSIGDCNLAILALVQGRLNEALALLSAPDACNPEDEQRAVGARLTRLSLLTLLHYESDDLDEAGRLLQQILPASKEAGISDVLIICHVLQARLAQLRGERDGCLRFLAELEQLGQQAGSARIQCAAWLERSRLALAEQRLDEAEQALVTAESWDDWVRPGVLFYGSDIDTPLIARQRLRIQRREFFAAVEALRPAIKEARSHQQGRRELKLLVLLTLALDGLGRRQGAAKAWENALELAAGEGLLRTFIEEGPLLADFLRRRQATAETAHPVFLQKLCSRLGVTPASDAANVSADALSTREVQVLQLLAGGQRNRTIAQALFLSECTVKSHLRKINAKLGAQDRTQAVAIARSRGLID
jgi:LuxR family maltose regulon positive regulatory protein